MNQNGIISKVIVNYKGKFFEISTKFRNGNDELIMFIHGLGCSKNSFEHVWDSSEFENYSLLTFDLVGYGDSSKPMDFSYDMEEQAELCNLLLNQFQYDKIHIVAHSMGGAIGLLLAERIKDRLASFISVEGNLIGDDCGIVSRKTVGYSFEEFQNKLFDKLIMSSRLSEDLSSKLWGEMLAKCNSSAFYKSAQSLVEWSDSNKLLSLFIDLKVNKKYIYGDKNSQMDVLKMLKDIERISISSSGHFIMSDNPYEFYKKLYNIM
ncbi:alpha/beta hydrolase [Clostridium thailandense]|uniref:Alpha/beta fold hydrolase n=1 Tax=Clostridium thailandense TaxID=2794346 RepID=A0A949U414_9CLOT|nr:alpha/beta fold hydrolase [Clostridium thailandense]MBV7276014.1 alpha/beta fold hydrolase [Clostridium thailandense]